jgi:hypothetical protein
MTSLLQNVCLGVRKRPVVGQLCQLTSEPVQLIRPTYLYGGTEFDYRVICSGNRRNT